MKGEGRKVKEEKKNLLKSEEMGGGEDVCETKDTK